MTKPIDLILYCPNCGMQHIDQPETERAYTGRLFESPWWELGGEKPERWTNPPHKSHLCRKEDGGCGCVWRPADVATNGVAELKTTGKDDTWPAKRNEEVRATMADAMMSVRNAGAPAGPANDLRQQATKVCDYLGDAYDGEPRRVIEALVSALGVPPCVNPLEDTGALGYAARLADGLWRKHYQQDAPNWQLCPDLLGILTQIDNMTTGLMKRPAGVPVVPPAGNTPFPMNVYLRDANELAAFIRQHTSGVDLPVGGGDAPR